MSPISSVLDEKAEAVGGARALGGAATNAPGTEEETCALCKFTVEGEEDRPRFRTFDETVVAPGT
jgi:hypothetical protein